MTSTETLLRALYAEATGTTFNNHTIQLRLSEAHMAQIVEQTDTPQDIGIRVKRGTVRGHGANQTKYLHKIATHDINFGIGPAGTGKTFLAVASAVEALNESRVQRLILVRPAVEAGEKLGFLPGDLNQKIDPYLRPCMTHFTKCWVWKRSSNYWKKTSSKSHHWLTCEDVHQQRLCHPG